MTDVHGTNDRALWCAVIAQALEDATRPLPGVGTSPYRQRERERAEARNYFAAMTRDFRHVCDLAGLDPDALLAMAQERIRLADSNQARSKPKPIKPREPTRLFTVDGISLTLSEWSKRLDIPYGTLTARIRKGWPMEKVMTSKTYPTRSRGRSTHESRFADD